LLLFGVVFCYCCRSMDRSIRLFGIRCRRSVILLSRNRSILIYLTIYYSLSSLSDIAIDRSIRLFGIFCRRSVLLLSSDRSILIYLAVYYSLNSLCDIAVDRSIYHDVWYSLSSLYDIAVDRLIYLSDFLLFFVFA